MTGEVSGARGMMLAYGAVSLAAVTVGAWICAAHGVAAGSWGRNLAAWLVGAVIAASLAATVRPGAASVALWVAPIGLLVTLFSPDQQGVHRWIDAGPLHVNMAMLLLPAAAVGLAVQAGRWWAWAAAFVSLGVLVAQPDASQATTLAIVMALVALGQMRRRGLQALVLAGAAGLAAAAWMRPDPLQPVAEVEEILGLAWRMSPLLAGLAGLLLVAVAAAPVLFSRTGSPTIRAAGLAVGACLLAWAAAPFLGAFPVPFVGVGMSAIVGGWLGAGLLPGLMRAQV